MVRVFDSDPAHLERVPLWLLVAAAPLGLVSTWGALFTFISCAAMSYVMYLQIQKGASIWLAARDRLMGSAFVVLLFYIYVSMFMHYTERDGADHYTLLTGSVEVGGLLTPHPQVFFATGALLLIGLSGMVVALTLGAAWHLCGTERWKAVAGIMLGGAALMILLQPILYWNFFHLQASWITSGNYGAALIIGWFLRPNFSLLPMGAYGFFGALFGLLLAREASASTIKRVGYSLGAILILASLAVWAIQGEFPDPFSHGIDPKMYLLNMGCFIILATVTVVFYDRCAENDFQRRAGKTVWVRRIGMIALTVYLLESLVSALLYQAFNWALPGAMPFNAPVSIAFLVILQVFWMTVVVLWARVDFKYSFEWLLTFILGRLRGKPSTRLNVRATLYGQE